MSDKNTKLIAVRDQFELHLFTDDSDRGWQLIGLVTTNRQASKRKWNLGWSPHQQRLARNQDYGSLLQHDPATLDWVISELRRPAADPIEHAVADATNIAADAATSSAAPALDARAEALARAGEDERRWRDAQLVKRREAEARKARESEERDSWHRTQLHDYLAMHGAFGAGPPWGQI